MVSTSVSTLNRPRNQFVKSFDSTSWTWVTVVSNSPLLFLQFQFHGSLLCVISPISASWVTIVSNSPLLFLQFQLHGSLLCPICHCYFSNFSFMGHYCVQFVIVISPISASWVTIVSNSPLLFLQFQFHGSLLCVISSNSVSRVTIVSNLPLLFLQFQFHGSLLCLIRNCFSNFSFMGHYCV